MDHHWSAHAAEVTARTIARHIQARQLDQGLPEVAFSREEQPTFNSGSYRNMVANPCALTIGREPYTTLAARRVKPPGLLDDDQPGIVVVGTSNTSPRPEDKEDSFVSALKVFLQRDVLNGSMSGGGPYAALQTFLASEQFRTRPPRVLIWELALYEPMTPIVSEYIPRAKGICPRPRFTLRDVLPSQASLNFQGQEGDYLVITTTNNAVKAVPIQLTSEQGSWDIRAWNHQYARPGIPFYAPLSQYVKAVQVKLPDASGPISVLICPK